MTQKLDSIDGDLNKAATDTDDLESKRDRVNETFIMNREKLQEAENEAKTAVDLANKVNEVKFNFCCTTYMLHVFLRLKTSCRTSLNVVSL